MFPAFEALLKANEGLLGWFYPKNDWGMGGFDLEVTWGPPDAK